MPTHQQMEEEKNSGGTQKKKSRKKRTSGRDESKARSLHVPDTANRG